MLSLQRHRLLAARLTEVCWNQLRPSLPKKSRRNATGTPVTYLNGVSLPRDCEDVLKFGPKFSLEPRAQKHELLATVHRVAMKSPPEERNHCVSEETDCLMKTWPGNKKSKDLRP
ncbi:hypothetical protein HPB52_020506 [Rhipicephalus sanguineus]|uniref:Uncharacterized protein n=1 Tax=Rhipicephalus sanguineus TaxID=34632 RepID=A0A9D4Q2U4_RHISA|nr:hypothetical protein HPB52_020506 [Rhipicephalus sanguineus]